MLSNHDLKFLGVVCTAVLSESMDRYAMFMTPAHVSRLYSVDPFFFARCGCMGRKAKILSLR